MTQEHFYQYFLLFNWMSNLLHELLLDYVLLSGILKEEIRIVIPKELY